MLRKIAIFTLLALFGIMVVGSALTSSQDPAPDQQQAQEAPKEERQEQEEEPQEPQEPAPVEVGVTVEVEGGAGVLGDIYVEGNERVELESLSTVERTFKAEAGDGIALTAVRYPPRGHLHCLVVADAEILFEQRTDTTDDTCNFSGEVPEQVEDR